MTEPQTLILKENKMPEEYKPQEKPGWGQGLTPRIVYAARVFIPRIIGVTIAGAALLGTVSVMQYMMDPPPTRWSGRENVREEIKNPWKTYEGISYRLKKDSKDTLEVKINPNTFFRMGVRSNWEDFKKTYPCAEHLPYSTNHNIILDTRISEDYCFSSGRK